MFSRTAQLVKRHIYKCIGLNTMTSKPEWIFTISVNNKKNSKFMLYSQKSFNLNLRLYLECDVV